jgi:cyclohexanone monooxygenase
VFQRTANFSIPAHNAPLDPAYEARIKADYAAFRARNSLMPAGFGSNMPRNEISAHSVSPEARRAAFEERWNRGGLGFTGAFNDLMLDASANTYAAEYVRERIRGIVKDPATAELLCPRQVIGCKRICVDTGYYETFNLPHVKLVDISQGGIEAITPAGVKAGGQEYPVDAIVFATGFDAMTGTLLKIDVRGRGGLTLQEAWRAGPRTYLGLQVEGFPNLFTLVGPHNSATFCNIPRCIEQNVDFVTAMLAELRDRGVRRAEPTPQAEAEWTAHVNETGEKLLFTQVDSWFMGINSNVPGKQTRTFLLYAGGAPAYREKCDEVAANGYRGFALS